MKIIRWIVGGLILFFDWLFTPRGIKRNPDEQTEVSKAAAGLTLYQFKACPFCVKVRRETKRLSVPLKTRDAKRDEEAKEELLSGGGKVKVPCLRIQKGDGNVEWLYESKDIISYLQQRFPAEEAA